MSQPARPIAESPLERVAPPHPSTRATGPVIGIDLGTSHLRVGVLKQGRPTLVPEGGRPGAIPSFVALDPRGKLLAGQAAQRQLVSSPAQTVWGVKRLLWPFRSPEVKALRQRMRCTFFEAPEGQTGVLLGGQRFSPRELMALLLLRAREQAQDFLGMPVYRAAIALPAGWDSSRDEALRAAAGLAGLHLERTVPEPIAAVLAIPREAGDYLERTLLVYDWGGGTFQASVVRGAGKRYQVLSSASDTSIGGVELDLRVLEHLLSGLPEKRMLLSDENAAAAIRITDAVERAKVLLSERAETRFRVPFVLSGQGQPRDLELGLTRRTLELLAEPLVERTLALCQQGVKASGLFAFDVDEIVLAGGQSQLPRVQQRLAEVFPQTAIRREVPEQAVALGTALAGART